MNTNYGLIVILDENLPFEELIKDVEDKFKESAKFFKNAKMAMTIRGRSLTQAEEKQVVETIVDSCGLHILCIIDEDRKEELLFHQAVDKAMEEKDAEDGWFYRGTLRSGQVLESEHSIVIIGDVEHGARVTAKGNVIILGELKGTVTAGAAGNDQAVILAFSMSPLQLRIGNHTSRFNEKNHKLGKGTMIASVENGELKVLPLKKPFFSSLLDL